MRPITAALLFLMCSLASPVPAHASLAPRVLADLQSFRGRIVYNAHRVDGSNAAPVTGNLIVRSDGWTLDEQSPSAVLHVSNSQSWVSSGSQSIVFDDPFEVGALANSWAVILGSMEGASLSPTAAGSSWNSSAGLHIYLDSTSSDVLGAADTRSSVAFGYGNWTEVSGVRLPRSILRLRDGAQDASFIVDGYVVDWVPKSQTDTAPAARTVASSSVRAGPAAMHTPAASPWKPFAALFMLFFLGVGLAAWTRRDVLGDRLIRHLAADPRGWRAEGVTVLVSPEGVLHFWGRPYYVGAAFYNRATTVQSSPLFIRVSAPQVPRVLILARKFARPTTFARTQAPGNSAGFTLVEALTAIALFAVVIVGVIFPVLVALSQADRLAQTRQAALQIAKNALVDEEAALEYGSGEIENGSSSTAMDGMKLVVTVSDSKVAGAHDLSVMVTDAGEHQLARVMTMVGPPVPPPSVSTSPSPSR